MEPVITTIVGALVAGATVAAKDVASDAIKSAYGQLKKLMGKYAGADDAIKGIEAEPESDLERKVLASRLGKAGAGVDAEAKATAQTLLDEIDKLRDTKGASALFEFDTLRKVRNVELTDIDTLGTVFRAKDATIEGDFKATGIRQAGAGSAKPKN